MDPPKCYIHVLDPQGLKRTGSQVLHSLVTACLCCWSSVTQPAAMGRDYLLLWSCQKALIAANSASFHLELARKVWGKQSGDSSRMELHCGILHSMTSPEGPGWHQAHLLKTQNLTEQMYFFFGSNPLKWSPCEEPDFVLTPRWEAEAGLVFTWRRDSSKKIHLNFLIWVFCGSTAICLPTE